MRKYIVKTFIALLSVYALVMGVPGFVLAANRLLGPDEIPVEKVSNVSSDGDFKYLVYSFKKFDPNTFTIVYLPGGPGGSITNESTAGDFGLVGNVNDQQYIFIDPPGTGMNLAMGEKDPDSLSSRLTVERTLSVIRKEHLTNYAIWGQSYGTVTATMLAYAIQSQPDMPAPKAVVLEGTFGRANVASKHFYEDFEYRMQRFYSDLPADTFELLKNYKQVEKNKADREDFLEMLFKNAAYESTTTRFETMNADLRTQIARVLGDKSVGYVKPDVPKSYSEMTLSGKETYLNARIVCRELIRANDQKDQQAYRQYAGQVAPPCDPPLNNPDLYDSKKYQITAAPMIYLQGLDDFQTPLPSALYHYNNQMHRAPGSSFSLIFHTNHGVFDRSFRSCLRPFLSDLRTSQLNLPNMNACAVAHRVEIHRY